jgi:hypothetical protein
VHSRRQGLRPSSHVRPHGCWPSVCRCLEHLHRPTAATCLSRLAGAPCPDIIDRSHYSRRHREAFTRSGELKQQLQGWHGQLSDMAVCISINGLPDHESTASRLSIRAASSQPGCAHASTLCGSTLAWALQGLLQSFMIRPADCTSSTCEPRCAMMHVSAVVIRCKSSLSRMVSPAHQDACRRRYVLLVYTWARDSPRANQLLDNSAVVTFMVLPSETKIDTRASPWLVSLLPTRRGSAQACRWICCWSLVRGVCCCCICMYTLSRRLRALHACVPVRVCRLVMMSKYSCTVP